MLTSNTAINTALSGLQAYQAAIDTTGENISNASTPGYTRQRVTLAEAPTLDISAVSRNTGEGIDVGTGVSIEGIQRVRDQFLDTQYRQANSTSSQAAEMASQLSDAQAALDDSSKSGISYALSQFMSSVNAMSTTDNGSTQAALLASARTLASTMNSVSSQLSAVQTDAGTELGQYMAAGGQVEQYADQLATLNTQIKQQTQAGQTPNTLLDQRDEIVDELSGLAQTTTSADANGDGGVSVTFAGHTLVSGASGVAVNFGSETNTDSSGTPLPTLSASSITSSSGGTLGALASLADPSSSGAIQTLLDQLNAVAQNVADTTNEKLTGTSPPTYPGATNIFTTPEGSTQTAVTAANLRVGTQAAATLAGSSVNATSLQALYGQSGSLTDDYSTFVDAVGTAAQSANTASTTSAAVTSAVDNQRQSVSGVSLDEEMSNLITYQQGYQASARVMNTQDEMISDLINTVGAGL